MPSQFPFEVELATLLTLLLFLIFVIDSIAFRREYVRDHKVYKKVKKVNSRMARMKLFPETPFLKYLQNSLPYGARK